MKIKLFSKLLIILLSVYALDTATKIWAEQTLSLYQPVPLGSDYLRLTLGYNTGVAFGMFSNLGIWPLVITGIVISGLTVWFIAILLMESWPSYTVWPIGMVLGGAIGNFLDRLPDQRVTDFIDVGVSTWRWPTFNIADSFIVVGLILLMLMTYHLPDKDEESSPETADNPTQLDTAPDSESKPLGL